jgi:hypothetical protein
MNKYFTKDNLLNLFDPEETIAEVKRFYKEYYTEKNLSKHIAYLSDTKPGRKSHAYAISNNHNDGEYLPHINTFNVDFMGKYPNISNLTNFVRICLNISLDARILFNVQEYYSDSSEVPKHNDGELLEFSINKDGTLSITESLRPAKVAVLTLINDVKNGAGTRIWNGNKNMVVKCKVGDLLVFDNIKCLHSVNAFSGNSIRKDGLLRLIIGWRSLDETCVHEYDDLQFHKSTWDIKQITYFWLKEKWPKKWRKIKKDLTKAAF